MLANRTALKINPINGFHSQDEINKKFIREFGCGYPGDEITKTWLKTCFDPCFGFPTIARFSWKTCHTIMESKQSQVNWYDPNPNEAKAMENKAKLKFQDQTTAARRKQNIATKKLGI